MSVYIKIKSASLNQRPASSVYLLIQSNSAILKTIETPSSKNPFWESSFICSIKQRYLHFRMCYNPNNNKITTLSSIIDLKNDKVFAVGELPFQYFQHQISRQKEMKLELVSHQKGKITKQGHLDLIVYYDPNKNYVGQMEFYQFGNLVQRNPLRTQNNETKAQRIQFKGQKPLFGQISSETKSSFLSMKSKNLFSCCDTPVRGHEYQIIEPHYFMP